VTSTGYVTERQVLHTGYHIIIESATLCGAVEKGSPLHDHKNNTVS